MPQPRPDVTAGTGLLPLGLGLDNLEDGGICTTCDVDVLIQRCPVAEFTSEVITRTVRRWIVPATPWGACIGGINAACAAACRATAKHAGRPRERRF
ncbi:hypothetical protein [Streptomyces acidiscabies]|uniref:Uncharacterized protein n=1 Tax=Streptomyces acidiscabies TaxID=42234 RepID=A0ABU4LWJ2_9ACTN|nr:hypothetical protein [Streptomyces acidiscabies]MDX3020043.1 hypothetical protein [Streptomyces acidiscabies]